LVTRQMAAMEQAGARGRAVATSRTAKASSGGALTRSGSNAGPPAAPPQISQPVRPGPPTGPALGPSRGAGPPLTPPHPPDGGAIRLRHCALLGYQSNTPANCHQNFFYGVQMSSETDLTLVGNPRISSHGCREPGLRCPPDAAANSHQNPAVGAAA